MNMNLSIYGGVQLAVKTWRQHREAARIYAARRQIRAALRQNFDALCETKCRALKSIGVVGSEHEHLETAIIHLAYALEDYRDGI